MNAFFPSLKSFKMRFIFLKRKLLSRASKRDTSVDLEHSNDTKSCIWPISCFWMVKTPHQEKKKKKERKKEIKRKKKDKK